MTALPLESLEIRGYRIFSEVTVPHLARVNLITGKNNSGKTALLEALRLYAGHADHETLLDILVRRHEFADDSLRGSRHGELVLAMLRGLFHGAAPMTEDRPAIYVGPAWSPGLDISFGWGEPNPPTSPALPPLSGDRAGASAGSVPWLVMSRGGAFRAHRIRDLKDLYHETTRGIEEFPPAIPCEHVPPGGQPLARDTSRWDRISLTDIEDQMVQAVQVVAPDVERVSVIGLEVMADLLERRPKEIVWEDALPRRLPEEIAWPDALPERIFRVRLRGQQAPVPLHSLGDGVRRAFGLVLPMVDARGGLLLIDEIENGLHHTIQADVWRHLLRLARALDVQIFATTHSYDAVEAFAEVIEEHPEDGVLIRLEQRDGRTYVTTFEGQDIIRVAHRRVEVR